MKTYNSRFNRSAHATLINILKSTMIDLVPIFFIGCMAIVLLGLPFAGWQAFLNDFAGGAIGQILKVVYLVTFGMQAVHLLLFFARHVCFEKSIGQIHQLGHMVSAAATYCIFGAIWELDLDILGPKGLFISLVSIVFSYTVYGVVARILQPKISGNWTNNISLSVATKAMLPIALTILISILVNTLLGLICNTGSVKGLIFHGILSFFDMLKGTFAANAAIVLFSSVLWFFGVHGTRALENVFFSVLAEAIMAGDGIFTQSFVTTFVLVGGSGATLGLVIAFIISARKNGYTLDNWQKVAFGISLFNINEFIVFGLPIIYNRKLVIPFLVTPMIFLVTSYAATYYGLVPKTPLGANFWIAPVFISGYLATGSFAGCVLQLFNLIIGTAIYYPFVNKYILSQQEQKKRRYDIMVAEEKANELENTKSDMLSIYSEYADVSNNIFTKLKQDIADENIPLFYQPQYDSDGRCVGGEALLRFTHPAYGFVYPPLVIEIARQSGLLLEFEKAIIKKALADILVCQQEVEGAYFKISANVTGETIQTSEFEEFLTRLAKKENLAERNFFIEITEQDFLKLDDVQRARFERLHKTGYRFAIDDFAMGSTSLSYLTGNTFDAIKLDGSLVQQVATNSRAKSVLASIIDLSKSLNLKTFAEYVSAEEIRDKLRLMGCEYYQGWYYSPAVPLEDFIQILARDAR